MARRHKRETGIEITVFRPGWVGQGLFTQSPILSHEQLFDLYRFYVVETPCENLSSSSISFSRRGWGTKPWKTEGNRLDGRLLKDRGFETNVNLFIGTSVNETKALFNEARLPARFKTTCREERIAFYHSENARFLSIARHIRNALAHGRMAAAMTDDEPMLFLEDVFKSKGTYAVRSRMVIRYSTLEAWMRIAKREEGWI